MPQKLNRAGNMQNYVPAGNGDPSGEYGDNATGSNRHFQSFEKPKENEININQSENINITNIKESFKERFSNATGGNIERFEKLSNDLNETTSPEMKNIINNYYSQNKDLNIMYSSSYRYAGCCSGFKRIEIVDNNVHTLRHETGHSMDNFYAQDLEENHKIGDKNLSTHYKDENGKTFNDYIHEEINMHPRERSFSGYRFSYKKTGIDKRENIKKFVEPIIKGYNDYCDSLLDDFTGIEGTKELVSKYITEKNAIDSEARRIANGKMINSSEEIEYKKTQKEYDDAMDKYREEMLRKGYYSITYSNSPEVQAAKQKYWDAHAKYDNKFEEVRSQELVNLGFPKEKQDFINDVDKFKRSREFRNKVDGIDGIIGDIIDYSGVGSSRYFTNGHGSSYFTKDFPTNGIALELFANFTDCYGDGKSKTWEVVKKIMPKTAKMYEKIIKEKINKNG